MSGHSKWHNIQGKKGKADKARANAFTKVSKAITIAAQNGGGDPAMNFSLRLAIDKAKEVNMPKDNIDRAIKKGTGELKDGVVLQEVVYEGYGPGGVAMLVESVTDNTNRALTEIKNAFTKSGGSLGSKGAVVWQFEYKAVLRIGAEKKTELKNWEQLELALMDAGVDDIRESENGVELVGPKEKFQTMNEVLQKAGISPDSASLEWMAKETMEIPEDQSEILGTLVEALYDLDDVKEVYTTAK
ncbi:MAG TPA: YebC/PmpR family DNA-binding transcriptional regulator [Candidatus Magasanikbacteria bacterium]|nr:YebC/PmpR family DNA-binding transcriptional regulator [Candidatus Magasanikbacteria bacterium]